jgi:uncharacterized protein YcfL
MDSRHWMIGMLAAIGLSACASIPQGPALSYQQLLANTHENPVWARQAAQPVPPDR